MSHATRWERDFDRRTRECVEAKEERDSRPQPHLWPASGPGAKRWNPTPPPPTTAEGALSRMADEAGEGDSR